jgi:hypothetical protein
MQMPLWGRSLLLVLILAVEIFLLFLIFLKWNRTHKPGSYLTDILLFLLLLADSTVLLSAQPNGTDAPFLLPEAVHILLLFTAITWCAAWLYREYRWYTTSITPASIREAFDNLPSGLCFSQSNGFPVLVNRKMSELALILTGQDMRGAGLFWQKVESVTEQSGSTSLHYAGAPAVLLLDGSLWRFTSSEIIADGKRYNQTIASDITQSFRLSLRIEEKNAELEAYHQRLKRLLENIARIKNEEEILKSKARVHDRLGRCVLATRRWLTGGDLTRDISSVLDEWHDVVRFIEITLKDAEQPSDYAMLELIETAAKLDCAISFEGASPDDMGRFPLLKDVVREALTNAIRHAGADRLTVRTDVQGDTLNALLYDNGTKQAESLTEGSGLSLLRRKIEQAGGWMEIGFEDGVQLRVSMPEKSSGVMSSSQLEII